VAAFQWHGDGRDLTIDAMGRRWSLKVDDPQPGLSWSDGRSVARLLSLRHVSMVGRRDEGAFDGSSLVSVERHRGRVQATFAPRAWQGLSIRAAWGPTPADEGFDLEVQVSVRSSRVFRRLEVAVGSDLSETIGPQKSDLAYRVQPRDVHAAALSYDGREASSVLSSLTTMPVPAASPHVLPPLVCRDAGGMPGPSYFEMVRPDDCARRIIGETDRRDAPSRGTFSIRYGLFGHDLEKGVVLRGRVRGIWGDFGSAGDEIRRQYEAFLGEPPALGP
jgi:hypothetical protein